MDRFIGRNGMVVKPISITIAGNTTSADASAIATNSIILNCAAIEKGAIVRLVQIVIHETKTGGAAAAQLRFVFCSKPQTQVINTTLAALPADVLSQAEAKSTYMSWGDNAIMTSKQDIVMKSDDTTRALHVVPLRLTAGAVGDLRVDFFFENY